VPERFVLLREVFAAISNPLFRGQAVSAGLPKCGRNDAIGASAV